MHPQDDFLASLLAAAREHERELRQFTSRHKQKLMQMAERLNSSSLEAALRLYCEKKRLVFEAGGEHEADLFWACLNDIIRNPSKNRRMQSASEQESEQLLLFGKKRMTPDTTNKEMQQARLIYLRQFADENGNILPAARGEKTKLLRQLWRRYNPDLDYAEFKAQFYSSLAHNREKDRVLLKALRKSGKRL